MPKADTCGPAFFRDVLRSTVKSRLTASATLQCVACRKKEAPTAGLGQFIGTRKRCLSPQYATRGWLLEPAKCYTVTLIPSSPRLAAFAVVAEQGSFTRAAVLK